MLFLSIWQYTLIALLLASLASFGWGMRKFFVQPAGMTAGMRLTAACGALFSALHFVALCIPRTIAPERGAAAFVLYLAALGLFWWAIAVNRSQPLSAVFSPDAPAHLTLSGPYRLIRHPFYCAYLFTWIAGYIGSGQIWLLPTVLVMFFIYLRASKHEEAKFSETPLAGDYELYRARTGRFVPNPLKLLMIGRAR